MQTMNTKEVNLLGRVTSLWVRRVLFHPAHRKWSLVHSTIKNKAHLKNLVWILLLTMM